MPVKQITEQPLSLEASALRDRLLAEWRNPDSTEAQPVILEKRQPGRPIELFVVWDQWESLNGVERSEIIMDAFIARYGQSASLDVTVAMGLTTTEAARFGLTY